MRVKGHVQGVGFRAWTQSNAEELALSGWVRNRSDGTVEALISGDMDHVDEMLKRANDGPPTAEVTRVAACYRWGAAANGFEQLPTI